jgi:hypothetical protein
MQHPSNLAEVVGLKHVVEDALAVLDGRGMEQSRREFVVRDLRKLLSDTMRGATIASQATLFLAEDDRQAFGSYTMVGRYLNSPDGPDAWRNDLPAAIRALEKLQASATPQVTEKQAASNILSRLLARISIDPAPDFDFEPAGSITV